MKKTKYLWLMGGFGNVLFQVLAHKILTKNGDRILFVDTLTRKNLITKIGKWSVHQNLYGELIPKQDIRTFSVIYSFFCVVSGFFSKATKRYFRFSSFYRGDSDLQKNLSRNIFGYFQEKQFLKRHADEIRSIGEHLNKLYRLNNPKGDVVVHFRKGDSGWIDEEYYNAVKKRIAGEKGTVVIVTDSPDNAKSFFSDTGHCNIIRSPNALDDFSILLSAKKLYCAPSTFSWWAAHSLDPGSKIVFPRFFERRIGIYTDCENEVI